MEYEVQKSQNMRIHKYTKPLERLYILNNEVLAQVDKAK